MEKSQKRVRWVVLVLSCVLMIGNYYCFDNPAALKSQLQQHFSQYPKERYEFLFNLLYTLYSVPNILLPFFGGVLVDRFGARVMLVTFSIAILVGQIIFAIGCSMYSFNIMLLGRVVFGFGGESLGVAQGTLVASWFKNSELALALGINLSVARLGSVINNELSPAIAHASSVSAALWVGVVMCIVSFLAVLVVIPIDKRDERTAQALRQGIKPTVVAQSISFGDIRHFRPAFWLLALSCVVVYGCVIPFNNVASSLLMERDFFKEPPSACVRCGEGAYADDFICPTIAPECPPVPPYSWPLPKLSANCTIKDPADQWNCTATPPLIDESKINCDDDAWKYGPLTKIYCAKKAEAAEKAATPMSIPYIISAVISPFLGFMVDRIGLRAVLALVAPISLTLVHVMLGLTKVSLYIPLVLQGISYSVFAAALWPSVPYVVEPKHVGSAYGAITSIQNVGLALFPLAVAEEYNHEGKYIPGVEMLFVTFGVLGSIVGVLLNIMDYQNGSVLNRSHQSKKTTLSLDDETTDTESLLSSEY
uniref:Lysosomal dipeptide transporter MFSD1 n=1 Tax=Globisporangium ultimum (strain ATCC 200006 / CBS 805.95 / DAOM BR144) TaxID=431595 RepID=K3WG66_GLOUD